MPPDPVFSHDQRVLVLAPRCLANRARRSAGRPLLSRWVPSLTTANGLRPLTEKLNWYPTCLKSGMFSVNKRIL
jgi:hypothetical protein